MQIDKIEVNNYRRFEKTEVTFSDSLTVIAGANNSGKTSLIHLFDCIFSNRGSLKAKDISLVSQNKISNSLFEIFNKRFISNLPEDKTQLKTEILDLFFSKTTGDLLVLHNHISVKITISYKQDENISLFAQYLMDLDETKRQFFFEVEQRININSLKNNIMIHTESLQSYLKRYYDTLKEFTELNGDSPSFLSVEQKLTKLKQLLVEKLFYIYGESLETNYKYADQSFTVLHKMEKRDFVDLFNYNYLSADRHLDDNATSGKKTLTSSVINLLNTEKKNETSPSQWKGKVNKMLNEMFNSISNANIDVYLVEQAKGLLNNISKNLNTVGETNIQEITMALDMSMDFLNQIFKEIISVNYAIPIDEKSTEKVFLAEESQGLGISNLIYITLELMKYKLTADFRKVNIFVIEEPEAHMHLQMQRTLVNHLYSEYKDTNTLCNIQGIISTHSDEIVRASELKNVRIIRPQKPLVNVICDMHTFLEKHKNDKEFYETFFRINFSNMIFADKAIIYEGDTERMYLESLIFGNHSEQELEEYKFLKTLSQKYITYAQAGGAYAHKYYELLRELEIKTLILTDIDYNKTCCSKEQVLESTSTNGAINCFFEQNKGTTLDKNPLIKDIYDWQTPLQPQENALIRTQTKNDGYARTLEEALLFNYIFVNFDNIFDANHEKKDFSVFTKITRKTWSAISRDSKFTLALPNRSESEKESHISIDEIKRNIREIVMSLSDKKSDFMYSIIMAKQQNIILPKYIKEGLEWLAQQ